MSTTFPVLFLWFVSLSLHGFPISTLPQFRVLVLIALRPNQVEIFIITSFLRGIYNITIISFFIFIAISFIILRWCRSSYHDPHNVSSSFCLRFLFSTSCRPPDSVACAGKFSFSTAPRTSASFELEMLSKLFTRELLTWVELIRLFTPTVAVIGPGKGVCVDR